MNKIERIIYGFVKRTPALKNALRNVYQAFFSMLPKKKVVSDYSIKTYEGYFFGFHDKIPWSLDNTKLLAHKFEIDRKTQREYAVSVGFIEDSKFKPIGKTDLWNWQQGSMLQWVGDQNHIIYNIFDNNQHMSIIKDISGNVIDTYDFPIGAVSKNGQYLVSYSFNRLKVGMPGYGYMKPSTEGENEDYLVLFNRHTKESIKLFHIDEIKQISPEETMQDAYHFFTHCLFNQSGNRLLFLHRWKIAGKRLYSRLVSTDLTGKNVHIFNTTDMVSHFSWIGDNQVIAYCQSINGDGYYIFDDISDIVLPIDKSLYSYDGHPQYSTANDLIVTDSYPNRSRIQEVTIFDKEKMTKRVIAKLFSPLKYKEQKRCDLHPRWNHDGNMICFDSVHTGIRSICTIELNGDQK